ncbi:MAG: type VI secretion system contractile sheath large subunit [Myxococcota bacterium]
MSHDEENGDGGGVVVGNISFGTAPEKNPAEKNPEASAPGPDEGPRPSLLDGEEDTLLPLRPVVVADLTPRGSYNAGANPPVEPVPLEHGGLDGLFARLAPRLAIEVDSVLDDGRPARIDFSPTSLKSFRPDALSRELPLLRALLDGKRVLDRLREGTADVTRAREELTRLWRGSALVTQVLGGVVPTAPGAAAGGPGGGGGGDAPAASVATDADVDRILDLVATHDDDDLTAAAPPPVAPAAAAPRAPAGRFDAFLAAVAGRSSRGQANPDEAIRTLEQAIGAQLGAIVQHPEFRRLEAAWRGLDFLLRRTPKTGVRLEVVSCRPEEAPAALERAIEHRFGLVPPVSFAIVDVAIGGDAASLGRLRALAEVGAGHAVPIITSASAALLGRDDLTDVDRLDHKGGLFEAPAAALWRKEAHRPEARWVSLALNPVLSRLAYDRRSSRIREAQVAEHPADEASAAVWMAPAWPLASLVVQSFGETGWPCRITGVRDGGVVADLPVREIGTGAERIAIPTRVFFSTDTQRALSRLGLIALASQPNRDDVYVLAAPTAYVRPPKKAYDSASTEPEVRAPDAPLPDQLFVARLAQYLGALGQRIGSHERKADIEAFLTAALWELFRDAAPGRLELDVAVSDDADDGRPRVAVTVRPGRFLGVATEEITLGVPLG